MSNWWPEFLDWHLRTEHPWDLALHREAMHLNVESVGREIGDALAPIIQKTADALAAVLRAGSA